jgi:hypothetical protein
MSELSSLSTFTDGGVPMMGPMPLPSPGLPRRAGEVVVNQSEPEYTVRGKLHWLGVMEDWNWEGMSAPHSSRRGLHY